MPGEGFTSFLYRYVMILVEAWKGAVHTAKGDPIPHLLCISMLTEDQQRGG